MSGSFTGARLFSFFFLPAFLFLACSLSPSAFSAIIKDDLYLKGETFYPFKQVCRELLKRESPLIEAVSITRLDCMGTQVDVNDFCKKKAAGHSEERSYARAVVDKRTGKVKCQSASRVILSYRCSKGELLCGDKEIGCYKLGSRLAANLDTVHTSLIKEDGEVKMNCYFSSLSRADQLKHRF